jgi:hypothetical protein
MKIGIVFFSLVKMVQGKPSRSFGTKSRPKYFILVSDYEASGEVLREKLANQLGKLVKLQNITKSFAENANAEIIFDLNYLNFKTIIETFETNKNKGFTFKILAKSSDYVIGSNSSFDRGEIMNI